MIVCYLRSSSLNTAEMCEQKYFLTYVLGFKDKQNLKATMGSIVHKALEILALKRIAEQKNESYVISDDFGVLTFDECDNIEYITKIAYDFYKKAEPSVYLTEEQYLICTDWVYKAIEYNNGVLDPRNQNIFAAELFFDIEIKKDWAWYEYELDGKMICGYFSIKGTMDLILEQSPNILCLQDFKTGKRKNWATGKEKTQKCLEKDNQLLLYYYALKNLYPDKDFYISIFYINDGGLFIFPFDEHDYTKAENMLKQKFQYIRSVQYPRLVSNDHRDFKCQKLCAFVHPVDLSNKSICHHFRDEIVKKGVDKVTEEYGDMEKMNSYQGGGRFNVKSK